MLGKLYSLQPHVMTASRILDIGCSNASNLLSIASMYPNSQCVGVDISTEQIESGRHMAEQLSLSNIELIAANIHDIAEDIAPFDYIVCHGVFSWIPIKDRQPLLTSIKKLLNPQGLVYLSYNALPGWEARGSLRQLMLLQTADISDQKDKVISARELMKWLAETLCDDQSPYGRSLKNEVENIKDQSDSFVLHELLNPDTTALSLPAFLREIEAARLRFVCEARFSRTLIHRINELNEIAVDKAILAIEKHKPLMIEQFLSFIFPSALRRSVLCHSHVSLDYKVNWQSIASFHISSALLPVANPDYQRSIPDEYASPHGYMIEVQEPLHKHALSALGKAWPQAISFDSLLSEISSIDCSHSKEHTKEQLILFLKDFYCKDLVEFYVTAPAISLKAASQPVVLPLARLQLSQQNWATNLRHEYVVLNEFERSLAQLCDGSRSVVQLAEELLIQVNNGRLQVAVSGVTVIDPNHQQQLITEYLPEALEELAQKALLAKSSR